LRGPPDFGMPRQLLGDQSPVSGQSGQRLFVRRL
jgi:hypothetical protein